MTDTTYVAFDVVKEDGRSGQWDIDPFRPTYGATITLSDGSIHRYANASHFDRGSGAAAHQYHVGSAGELYVVLILMEHWESGTVGHAKNPRGLHNERVLRTYAPGTWSLVEGEFRATIDNIDPAVNLLDRKNEAS